MSGKFEVFCDGDGDWRFRLKTRNGRQAATGGPYKTKRAARNGCESTARAAQDADIVDGDTAA